LEIALEERTIRHLFWIKWLLVIVITVLAIPMVISAWFMSSAFSTLNTAGVDCKAPKSEIPFHDQAKELLLSGKEQEVLTLATAREAEFPKDPDVYYMRGRAYFQTNEYDKAIQALETAETLAPAWRDQYTGPYLREAKRRKTLSASLGDNNAKISPREDEIAVYEMQIKKAVEQQQRMDQLLTVQEQQAKRFGVVLERWERQTGPRTP
jgi:tetratricopeptide (TPR) repeat protein